MPLGSRAKVRFVFHSTADGCFSSGQRLLEATSVQMEEHTAEASKYPNILVAAHAGNLRAVQHFLRAKAGALQETDKNGCTALLDCKGHQEVVSTLASQANLETKEGHRRQSTATAVKT